jgi:pectin methylesterase-like acyl-CoA thioesterase
MKQSLILLLLFICLTANAQLFRCIVAADGSGTYTTVQSAIDACPEGQQSLVFIKNGIYNEQVSLGSKTTASTKKISLIGESAMGVIITHSQSRASSGSPTFEDICTVKLYANDFYAENITIQNTAGNTGMAEALYTAGDRQTFKNCRILGYQDTYRSKKGTRGYFKNCWIEGAVDFIYAGGVEFFDDCTINCVNGGGYITAPEDAYVTIPKASTVCQKFLRVGFFFRNCEITANSDVPDNSYYLGRPWVSMAGTFYLNCKLGKHIKPAGWKEWSGNETSSSFAEYNSTDMNGNPIDTASRVSWSFQLPKADVDSLLSLQRIYNRVSTTLYNPLPLCKAPKAPASVSVNENVISWSAVDSVAGYIVMKDGHYFNSLNETTCTDNSGITGTYSVKSAGLSGQLSAETSASTSVQNISESKLRVSISNNILQLSEPVSLILYSANGKKIISSGICTSVSIKNISSGAYILQTQDAENHMETKKIIIGNK